MSLLFLLQEIGYFAALMQFFTKFVVWIYLQYITGLCICHSHGAKDYKLPEESANHICFAVKHSNASEIPCLGHCLYLNGFFWD